MHAAGNPHEALFLVLSYLPLHQLLSMSRVCKSFKDAISDDVLIWLDLIVERPLNLRLTDEILMRITAKAQGRLRTLALLNCVKITDVGLMKVINANPLLTELYVPDCTGLTPEIVVETVKTLSKLNKVYIDGLYNIKQEHLQVLRYHINQTTERKPRLYHKYSNSVFPSLDESSSYIDVEVCPKCKEVKLVFDCPRVECRARKGPARECVGCSDCIQRCEGCGKCVSEFSDDELGETLCNDCLCLDCWLGLPKCNHCNKPLCPRHADTQLTLPDCGGFVCATCETKCLAET